MLVRVANREDWGKDPDQTGVKTLIRLLLKNWVCNACLSLFGRQLVFKILENLP